GGSGPIYREPGTSHLQALFVEREQLRGAGALYRTCPWQRARSTWTFRRLAFAHRLASSAALHAAVVSNLAQPSRAGQGFVDLRCDGLRNRPGSMTDRSGEAPGSVK